MAEKLEMKRCKECGKMFVPRHKRQVYCDDVHYRPCPVCGKLVEAKYLSDPARVCSNECRKILAQRTKSQMKETLVPVDVPVSDDTLVTEDSLRASDDTLVTEDEINVSVTSSDSEVVEPAASKETSESDYASQLRDNHKVKRYEGKAVLGFVPGHEYAVDIEKSDYVYNVTALYDFTEGKSVDLMMPVSSKTSFYRSFKSVDK